MVDPFLLPFLPTLGGQVLSRFGACVGASPCNPHEAGVGQCSYRKHELWLELGAFLITGVSDVRLSACKWPDSGIAAARAIVRRIIGRWHALPLLCSFCCHPIDGDSVSETEHMGWCPNCKRPFQAALFRIPGWVAGTIVLLAIKAHAGI